MNLRDSVETARFVSTPILSIDTDDYAGCISMLITSGALNVAGTDTPAPVVRWDIADGMREITEKGFPEITAKGLEQINKHLPPMPTLPGMPPPPPPASQGQADAQAASRQAQTRMPGVALKMFGEFDRNSVAFFVVLSPQEFYRDQTVVQLISSLRDKLKKDSRMLILIGPKAQIPASLRVDIKHLHDPYPTLPELETIVKVRHVDIKKHNPEARDLTPDDIAKAALLMQGVPRFKAETIVSGSFVEEGVDFDELRDQRYEEINDVPGLTVSRDPESFDSLKGVDGLKRNLLRLESSKRRRIGCIVYIDEIGLEMSGTDGGDLSGMSDQLLKMLLKYMQLRKILGILLLGPAGTGKTAICNAFGNHLQVPTLSWDLGLVRHHHMGETEANMQRCFDTVDGVSGGYPLFLASTNSAHKLATPLLRRFRLGRYYLLPPDKAARRLMWQNKILQYGLDPNLEIPEDDGWVGAEIDVCCDQASLLGISLLEAAESIVPVTKARPDELIAMHREAHNKYTDARTGTIYQYAPETVAAQAATEEQDSGRQITLAKRGRGH